MNKSINRYLLDYGIGCHEIYNKMRISYKNFNNSSLEIQRKNIIFVGHQYGMNNEESINFFNHIECILYRFYTIKYISEIIK